jgi:hypothetical protein
MFSTFGSLAVLAFKGFRPSALRRRLSTVLPFRVFSKGSVLLNFSVLNKKPQKKRLSDLNPKGATPHYSLFWNLRQPGCHGL